MEEYYINLNVCNEAREKTETLQIEINLDKLDNFNDFACKILKKADSKLTLRKSHLEIFYEDDWIKLIDLKSFYFFVSNNIHLGKQINLRIAEIKTNNHELFDLEGLKYKNEVLDDSNRPTDKIYDRRKLPEVYCAICAHSSKDDHMATQLGCFYGPFKDFKLQKQYFLHELCALWTPNIFLGADGKLKNVLKEIRRSQKIRCSYCHTKGAGLACSQPKCRKDYHYLCALATECITDNQKYIVFCKTHFEQNEGNNNENAYFVSGINNEDNEEEFNKTEEDFGDCVVCLSGLDEDKLLICEKCQKTIHTYCSIPVINEIPEGDYFCNKCLAIDKRRGFIDNNYKDEFKNDVEMTQN